MSKLFRFVENGEDAVSVTENAECDLTDNEADEALDDLEEDHVVNGNEVEDDQVECEEEQQEPEIVDPYAGLTEEEKEAKIRQEQIMAKKQKVNLHKVDLCQSLTSNIHLNIFKSSKFENNFCIDVESYQFNTTFHKTLVINLRSTA